MPRPADEIGYRTVAAKMRQLLGFQGREDLHTLGHSGDGWPVLRRVVLAPRPIDGNAVRIQSLELFKEDRDRPRRSQLEIDQISREDNKIDPLLDCRTDDPLSREIGGVDQKVA